MCFNRIKLNNQFLVIYANEQSDSASKKKGSTNRRSFFGGKNINITYL